MEPNPMMNAFRRNRLFHPKSVREWGQTMAFMVIALPAFVGAMGLAVDVGNFYYNYYRLQSAVDAAALVGAKCLGTTNPSNIAATAPGCNGTCGTGSTSPCTPSQTATYYATTLNGVQSGEVIAPNSPAPYQIKIGATRDVPYYFARLVGTNSGSVSVSATAQGGALGTSYNAFPVAIQYCGTATASACYTQYTTYDLSNGTVAPGNWGPVSSGTTGSVSICTGAPCLPVDTGCASIKGVAYSNPDSALNRINSALGNPLYSGDTPSSYVAGDPRLVTVPLVDWAPAHGAATPLNVYGFAEFFLTGVVKGSGCSKGDPIISGQFINAVANGTTTSAGNADLGATAVKLIQ
jgi:Flp pilus assembly protein TadG